MFHQSHHVGDVDGTGEEFKIVDDCADIDLRVFADFDNVNEIVRGQHITSCRIYITMPCTLDCRVVMEVARHSPPSVSLYAILPKKRSWISCPFCMHSRSM